MCRRLISVIAIALLSCSCTRVEQEEPSPDGRYVARVVTVNGGAMSSGGTKVTLSASGSLPALRHDVFFSAGIYEVSVHWKQNVLEVVCEYCPPRRIEVKEMTWRDVTIAYPRLGAKAVRD